MDRNITQYESLRNPKLTQGGMVSTHANTKIAAMKPNRLKQRRKELKLTQAAIAERLNCSEGQISRWENARDGIPSQRIDAILKAYEATFDELFGSGEVAGIVPTPPPLRTILMPVALPSEEILTGIMWVLLEQLGLDPAEADRAQKLAQLFPDLFQFGVSWTGDPGSFLASVRDADRPSDDDTSLSQ